MQVQLIATPLGYAAAGWQEGLLAGVTSPQADKAVALSTLGEYLKIKEDLSLRVLDKTETHQQRLAEDVLRYFQGELVTFTVPIQWDRMTFFQQQVLKLVHQIPHGKTRSYGEIASMLGSPKGSRAVGGAVGANPWLLVVPCHRVLAYDCKLGGFSSGLDWKRRLLKIENIPYKE